MLAAAFPAKSGESQRQIQQLPKSEGTGPTG